MKSICYRLSLLVTVVTVVFLLAVFQTSAEEDAPTGPAGGGLQQRIDFSSAQILGQSIKSGAVYLMHRKQSEISSMLKVRQDYRKEIMEDFSIEGSALILETADDERKGSDAVQTMNNQAASDADQALSVRRNGNKANTKPK